MKKLLILLSAVLLFVGCGSPPSAPPPVGDAPTVSLSATTPVGPNADGSYNSTLIWTSKNALEVTISGYPAVNASSGSGAQTVTLTEPVTRYAILASGPGGTAAAEVAINIPIPGIPKPIPAIPASVSATVTGSGTVQVSWFNVNSPFDGSTQVGMSYDVYMDGILKQSNATSPLIIGGLTNGTKYSFTVKAVYTNVAGTRFESVDSPPATATPMAEVKDITVTVSWDLPTTYTDGSAIAPEDAARIEVAIFVNTTGGPPWGTHIAASLPGATSVSFTMTTTAGQTYYFTATASLDGQVSDYSIPVTHVWNEPLP